MEEINKMAAVLTFKNEDGSNVTMTISPVPRSVLEKDDLVACMDAIIAQNCFTSKGGDLVSKVKAQIVDTSTELYNFEQ